MQRIFNWIWVWISFVVVLLCWINVCQAIFLDHYHTKYLIAQLLSHQMHLLKYTVTITVIIAVKLNYNIIGDIVFFQFVISWQPPAKFWWSTDAEGKTLWKKSRAETKRQAKKTTKWYQMKNPLKAVKKQKKQKLLKDNETNNKGSVRFLKIVTRPNMHCFWPLFLCLP